MRLVECVPNFSEGKDEKVIRAIAQALQAPGSELLDFSWDADHNRSVMTVVGEPEAVLEAVFQAVNTAVRLIDMRKHSGDHPRMGAADVVPFVPVKGVTLSECVDMASRLAERMGRELELPVFLYGEAARVPERKSLAYVRKGQFEGLQREISRPERRPDFGPSRMHPTAGATAVGARNPLVAYNINLASQDLDLARRIAVRVRTSSGGLPHVMATAVNLREKDEVQVSMNLTNPVETPIHEVYECVEREAALSGVGISSSEVIGLVPLEVLLDVGRHFLNLEGFQMGQVMEARLLDGLVREADRRG